MRGSVRVGGRPDGARPPWAHDPRAAWGSLIVGVRSELSRPSEHGEKPRSGGAFRGFATHGESGAAPAWGAFRGFATLGARETASEWGRVSMARDPRTRRKDAEPGRVTRVRDLQRMQDSLIAGARFRGTRSSERAGWPCVEGPFRASAIFGVSGAAPELERAPTVRDRPITRDSLKTGVHFEGAWPSELLKFPLRGHNSLFKNSL